MKDDKIQKIWREIYTLITAEVVPNELDELNKMQPGTTSSDDLTIGIAFAIESKVSGNYWQLK